MRMDCFNNESVIPLFLMAAHGLQQWCSARHSGWVLFTTCPTVVKPLSKVQLNSHFNPTPQFARGIAQASIFQRLLCPCCDAYVLIDGPTLRNFLFNQGLRGTRGHTNWDFSLPVLQLQGYNQLSQPTGPDPHRVRPFLATLQSAWQGGGSQRACAGQRQRKHLDTRTATSETTAESSNPNQETWNDNSTKPIPWKGFWIARSLGWAEDPALLATCNRVPRRRLTRVALDHGSENTFDTSYFDNLRTPRSPESDAETVDRQFHKPSVEGFQGNRRTGWAEVQPGVPDVHGERLSNIEVKTGE
nr:heme peroxidase [Ipomoea batatas]